MNTEDKFNHTIARRVREARKSSGLTQEDVGNKIGLSAVGYGHYERGTHAFSTWQLFQVSQVLGRPVEWFLGLDTDLTADEGQVLALYRRAKEKGLADLALRTVAAVAGDG